MTIDELATGLNQGRPTQVVIADDLPDWVLGVAAFDPASGCDLLKLHPNIQSQYRYWLAHVVCHELGHFNLGHVVRTPEAGRARPIPTHELDDAGRRYRERIEQEATTFGNLLEAELDAALADKGIGDLNRVLRELLSRKEVTA